MSMEISGAFAPCTLPIATLCCERRAGHVRHGRAYSDARMTCTQDGITHLEHCKARLAAGVYWDDLQLLLRQILSIDLHKRYRLCALPISITAETPLTAKSFTRLSKSSSSL